MRSNWSFFLSHWLTFSLALACLAVSDTTARGWLYPVLWLALTGLMAFPSKWNLSVWMANLLGLVVIGGWLVWVLAEFYGQQLEGLAGEDWLRIGFVRGGTLLVLLLLAKWLRPRSAGDYWMMHALALVQVVLACATLPARTDDMGYRWFPALLLGYLASAAWAVIVLHMCRESHRGDPAKAPWPQQFWLWRFGLLSGLGWCGAGLAMAVVLFLTVPRVGSRSIPPWLQAGTVQALSGISTGIDLTTGDSVRLSEELVVRVDAWDTAGNKQWLGEDLRLRVLTCSVYAQGKWRPSAQMDLAYLPYRLPITTRPGTYRLQFQADLTKLPAAMGLELPDIEEFRAGAAFPLPLAEPHPALVRPRNGHWFHAEADLLAAGVRYQEPALWVTLIGQARILRYEQLYDRQAEIPESTLPEPPSDSPLRSPGFPPRFSTSPRPLGAGLESRLDMLPRDLRQSGRIAQFAETILRRHRFNAGAIPGESADQVLSKVKVLEHYLANNAEEFVYSLSRPRQRHDLDPTEEFLLEPVTADGKKAGWCQHYASALALLLRSQQIPARIVIGFRGADWNPTWRTHEIRAYHAHAWVEALIGPRDRNGRITHGRWLAFDPTPAAALLTLPARRSSWWRMLADDLRYLWEIIVLDGTTGQGFRAFATVNTLLDSLRIADLTGQEVAVTLLRIIGAVGLVVAAVWIWRHLQRTRASPTKRSLPFAPITDWERALIQWLERCLRRRKPGESLLEYAQAAERWLTEQGCPSAELASLPVRMTEAYYRFRFAALSPSASELTEFQRQLQELARFLDASPSREG